VTTAAEILDIAKAAGVRLRVDGDKLAASPRERLTDDLRELIRGHRAELLRALAASQAEASGVNCMGCQHLCMRVERHAGTRRIFWWRCGKGHTLLEGRNYGERVMLAPPQCCDFKQWEPGTS
jgi:hypothetical protein